MFTLKDVREAALETVAELGDQVYQKIEQHDDLAFAVEDKCAYTTPDGAPSCLVGQVFARIDQDRLATLHDYEWNGQGFNGSKPVSLVLRDEYAEYTDAAAHWLSAVQANQDIGFAWLEAIRLADQTLGGSSPTPEEQEYINTI